MGKVFIEENNLTAIGDAIREKTGKTDLLNPTAMPEEIKNIETGSSTPTTMMVRRYYYSGYKPTFIDAYDKAQNYYVTTTAYEQRYYWYRSTNTNVYWHVASWNTSGFTEGHQYRLSFWIWHNADVSEEPVKIWQNNFFINANTQAAMPITEIRTEPQLVSVVVTYVPDSVYGFSLYLYPEDSGNQVRMSPVIIEDLTNPSTGVVTPL